VPRPTKIHLACSLPPRISLAIGESNLLETKAEIFAKFIVNITTLLPKIPSCMWLDSEHRIYSTNDELASISKIDFRDETIVTRFYEWKLLDLQKQATLANLTAIDELQTMMKEANFSQLADWPELEHLPEKLITTKIVIQELKNVSIINNITSAVHALEELIRAPVKEITIAMAKPLDTLTTWLQAKTKHIEIACITLLPLSVLLSMIGLYLKHKRRSARNGYRLAPAVEYNKSGSTEIDLNLDKKEDSSLNRVSHASPTTT
jgi:hypothetical protein